MKSKAIKALEEMIKGLPEDMGRSIMEHARLVKAELPEIFKKIGEEPRTDIGNQIVFLAGIRKFFSIVSSTFSVLDNSISIMGLKKGVYKVKIGPRDLSKGSKSYRTFSELRDKMRKILIEYGMDDSMLGQPYSEIIRKLMDIKKLNTMKQDMHDFVESHGGALCMASETRSKIFELGTIVGVAEHYCSNGYDVELENLKSGSFAVKTSHQGSPLEFSWIRLGNGISEFDLHMNLNVRSAHDQGIYCVDVGIVKPGLVQKRDNSLCLENEHLISFAEAKKIDIHPMLLAQFIGIVHEIKPEFIYRKIYGEFIEDKHLVPCLICTGHFSDNSQNIMDGYRRRGANVEVCENFDFRMAMVANGDKKTPFDEKFKMKRRSGR